MSNELNIAPHLKGCKIRKYRDYAGDIHVVAVIGGQEFHLCFEFKDHSTGENSKSFAKKSYWNESIADILRCETPVEQGYKKSCELKLIKEFIVA